MTGVFGNSVVEQIGAGVGELIQSEPRSGKLGEDGEQARAGRGLQHEIGRRDRGCRRGGEAEGDRRGELLKRLGLLGASGLRREQRRELAEHGEEGCRRSRAGAHGGAELAQEQDLRRLAGIVGKLPIPGAFRVGTAERGLHRRAQRMGVERAAPAKRLRQCSAGLEKCRLGIGPGMFGEQREGGRGLRRSGNDELHGEVSGSGVGGGPGRALSSPAGPHLTPGRPLPLDGRK